MDNSFSFLIDSGTIRGQAIRLDGVLNDIIGRHGYPDVVNGFLAEATALAIILSASLKYDGVFTLQIQGDGCISSLIVSITGDGKVRAYARFNEKRLAEKTKEFEQRPTARVQAFFGDGTLMFTVVQNTSADRYQGVVSLECATLSECVHRYFRQSEQIETAIRLKAVQKPEAKNEWVCGAVMIQRMPAKKEVVDAFGEEELEEMWRTAVILLNSATDEELCGTQLPIDKLLYRLYHANKINIFMPKEYEFGCKCTKERVIEMLRSFPSSELRDMEQDGTIKVDCQFCGKSYTVDVRELDSGE